MTETRTHSPTAYSLTFQPPREEAIHKLTETCRQAVVEYDRSDDHTRHGPGSDCIRCGVAAAVWPDGGPAPVFRKAGSHGFFTDAPTPVRHALFLAEVTEGFVRLPPAEAEAAIARAEAAILEKFPGMGVTVARLAKDARDGRAAWAFHDAFFLGKVNEGPLLREWERIVDALSKDARQAARIVAGAE